MIVGDAGDTTLSPAGPYSAPRQDGRGYQAVAANPARTGEKVLRIVFPSHIDGAGRLHDTRAIHAVVDNPNWQSASAAEAVAASPAEVAAHTGGDTLLAAVERVDPPVGTVDPDLPPAEAVEAARARAQDPVGAIRDDVARKLATAPRTKARSPVASLKTNAPTARVTSPARPLSTAATTTPATSSALSNRRVVAPLPARVGTIVPKNATEEGKAAIKSVNESAALQAASNTLETTARAGAKSAPLPTVRAPSFPGVSGADR
nr:TraV family lipoprotein [Sphingomonas xinjiangensis]